MNQLLKRMENRMTNTFFNLRFCQNASKLQTYVSVITNNEMPKNNMCPKAWN